MANINPIADLNGTVIGKDVFMMPRIMNGVQNKIRLSRDYSVKMVSWHDIR